MSKNKLLKYPLNVAKLVKESAHNEFIRLLEQDLDHEGLEEVEETDENEGMSEKDLERFLAEAIEMYADESGESRRIDVATFRDYGVLTTNRGLVLTIGRDKFQITIVRSY